MFLQSLWKKFNNLFSSLFKKTDVKKIENFVNESFKDILKVIGIIGGVIIFLILVITLIVARNSNPPEKKVSAMSTQVKEEKIKPDTSILLADEFMYPPVESFEIKADYNNFMEIKKYKIPDFNSIKYDIILTDIINESCRFDFEKRR